MLTTGEVAKLFHVSAQTVINWLDQGRMPFERIGRGPRRLTEESVIKYVDEIGISPDALDEEIYSKACRVAAANRHGANGPAVIVTDADLRIVAWNDGARSIYGYTQVEMLGKALGRVPTQCNGSEKGLDILAKSPWQDKCLQVNAVQETRHGKKIETVITLSRFYMDGIIAGYTVACKEIKEKEFVPGKEALTARY